LGEYEKSSAEAGLPENLFHEPRGRERALTTGQSGEGSGEEFGNLAKMQEFQYLVWK